MHDPHIPRPWTRWDMRAIQQRVAPSHKEEKHEMEGTFRLITFLTLVLFGKIKNYVVIFSLLSNIDMCMEFDNIIKPIQLKFWQCYQFDKILALPNFGKVYFSINLTQTRNMIRTRGNRRRWHRDRGERRKKIWLTCGSWTNLCYDSVIWQKVMGWRQGLI